MFEPILLPELRNSRSSLDLLGLRLSLIITQAKNDGHQWGRH